MNNVQHNYSSVFSYTILSSEVVFLTLFISVLIISKIVTSNTSIIKITMNVHKESFILIKNQCIFIKSLSKYSI